AGCWGVGSAINSPQKNNSFDLRTRSATLTKQMLRIFHAHAHVRLVGQFNSTALSTFQRIF
ncbi:MAG: hypothetical protein IJW31_05615, partial [Lentisphaeria bacterium]|nr:hypothetical protein [Lentisphaeria bacterium]